jgi:hypothetical protein
MRIAGALALWVLLASCALGGAAPAATPVAGTTSTPTQAASKPRITPPAVTPPTAPDTTLPAFKCADISGGAAGTAKVTAVRVSEQPGAGYDRFVLQFNSAVPQYTIKRQAKPTFATGGSGQPVTLSGTAGVLVQVHSASESGSYTGPTDLSHGEFAILKEARLTEDFEGYVSWGIGLGKPSCMRAFTLADPARLVVDFSTTS